MKIRAYCFSKCNKHPGFSVGSKKTFWVSSPGQRHGRHHEQTQRRLLKGTGLAKSLQQRSLTDGELLPSRGLQPGQGIR